MRNALAFRRTLLLSAICLALPASAIGQSSKPKLELAGPTLTAWSNGIRSDANKREIRVSSLDVSVEVRGDIAETTVTATFSNPTNDLLEGQFRLNMPRNAVITGYALDVNGTLIDGVLETKYKAAEAYQRRVSQRIDPGLAEVDYSDKFETRIYPIPQRGSRTIRLRMVSAFDPAEGYSLPLTMAGKVGKMSLTIDGDVRAVSMPQSLSGNSDKFTGENVSLSGALKLEAAKRETPMLVSEHPGAERFFDLVAPAPKPKATKDLPLHIFWDRSVSRTDDALKAEAELARDLAADRGLRRVKVTLFDSGAIETRDIAVDRLVPELGEVHYRGGTSYATLLGATVAPGADCLMFSDGRVTIDERSGFALNCRIFSVTSGPESDRAWLTEVSERSGGVAIDLASMKTDKALSKLQKPEAGILSVTNSSGARIDTVRLASEAGTFHIVGPMPDNGPVLVWILGEAGPRRFGAPGRSDIFSGPGALWARHRLGVVASDLPPDDLAKMARRYGVATPQASFVVLESPNDYVQSDIEPPATYPKALRQQYVSLRRNADEDEARARAGRLDVVASLWSNQKEWWTAEFKGVRKADKDKLARADGGAARADGDDRPRPAASAPPPADVILPEQEARERDNIVVTGSRIASTAEDAASPVSVIEFAKSLSVSGGDSEEVNQGRAGKIELTEWKADRPYLKRLDKAKDWEAALDKEMKENGALPLFWFDIAEWHWRAGRKEEARRAAEAALDLPTRDNQTLAIAAARLLRYGSHDRAIWLLEKLAEREADRPQPLRTLALALIERSRAAKTQQLAKADLERAVTLLSKAATDVFDVNATGVEEVTLMEANAALARLTAMGGASTALDRKLVANLEADVRVVMEWNTPRTDLDLWITEPNGEKVGYSTPTSSWGGKLSGDVTNGYGPEEYLMKKARKGVYEIRANTFASDRSNPNGPSTLTVRVIRNFGRPGQSEQLIDIEMDAEDRGERQIGKITIE
ncbi:MAG: VIT domain-containing protein [Hyphomonadaceae bacterium]|nr:VIT domain-containing protein [Hyphomonadaceae bacterium]